MAMNVDDLATLFTLVGNHLEDHGMRPMEWNAMTGCISTVQTYSQSGWKKVPTPKQTKQIFKAQQFLKDLASEPATEL